MRWQKRVAKKKINSSDTVLEQLGKIRGIDDLETFLNPTEDLLNDPYLLENIEDASNRIIKAIAGKERICVSADCDADGIFSTAIMMRYVRHFTDNVYAIYNQRSQGHGIENQMHKIEEDTDLLIILDSSSNSVKECKMIREKGIDIVILDHHAIEEENPHAILVNPQKDMYPNKEISGAGVTWKTVQVMDDTLGSDLPNEMYDLVACGMYADMMDVSVPENRYMIINGLKNIQNPGLQAILYVKNVDQDSINSKTIGYTISPLINGMARLDKIELSISLLLEDDYETCVHMVKEMLENNDERKRIERELMETYLPQVNENDKIIVVYDEKASKGFNGLVAQKIAEKFQRPTLVLRDHKGTLSGSFRSYGDFNVKDFLAKIPVVEYALGHEQAGGVGFKKSDLPKLIDAVNRLLVDVTFESVTEYDLEIKASDINDAMISDIDSFNILTGKGFDRVMVKVVDLLVTERRHMGKEKNHVKIITNDGVDIIKFNDGDYGSDIDEDDVIEVLGELNVNEWFNPRQRKLIVTNQVFVEDYKIQSSLF